MASRPLSLVVPRAPAPIPSELVSARACSVCDSGAPALLGRADALADVRAWLEEGTGLLSITGPAGVGKSSLARAALDEAAPSEPDVRWVSCELATIADVAGLCTEVARAIDRPLAGAPDPIEWVAAGLAARPTVLVLHDVERVLPAATHAIGRWVELTAELRVIATTRVRLGIDGEQVLELAPLALPAPGADPATSPAVQLFVRAVAARGVSIEPSADVAALVAALDGLPLAIELAAARARVLSPREMLAWIDRRFELLRDRRGGRHSSLEDEIAASYGALDDDAQKVLRAASIFGAAFSAEAVGAAADSRRVLDALDILRDASLLAIATTDEPGAPRRFRLLAAIRAFARAELERLGEHDDASLRAARWHAERSREMYDALEGPDPHAAELFVLGARADMLASAHHLVARGEIDDAVAIFASVRRASRRADDFSGLPALSSAMEPLLDRATLGVRLEGLRTMAMLAARVGRFAESRALAERLENVAREAGHTRYIAEALRIAGGAWIATGSLDRAIELIEAAEELARSLGDVRVHTLTSYALAGIHRRLGSLDRARAHATVALELARPRGPRALADVLIDVAAIDLEMGDVDLARRRVELGFACTREGGLERSRLPVVLTLVDARIHHATGDLEGARDRYERASRLAGMRGDPLVERMSRLYASIAIWELGDVREACDRLREHLGSVNDLERVHATWIRALLGGGEALLGNPAEAEASIAPAVEALRGGRADAMAAAADACWGFVEIARAHDAAERGDPDEEATWRARAEARLAALAPSGPPRAIESLVVARLLGRALRSPRPRAEPRMLEVEAGGAWFAVGGARVPVGKRPTMKRMLLALVEARLARPGASIDRAGLLDAGWPGERMLERAAQRRLQVMISRMRELGLRDVLETTDDGYRIAPSCRVELHRAS